MAVNRNKEIQVQRPAQSLEHFKSKVASAEDVPSGILKPVLMGAGVLVLGLLAWGGISTIRTRAVERHEAALASILREVEGSASNPLAPADMEKRMREKLPALEALASAAPSSRKAVALGLAAKWRLAVDGKATPPAEAGDPWGRLRLAQQKLALGQGPEAQALLAPLQKDATPQEAWSSLFWTTLMESHRLTGNRAQALKDFSEYRDRFKAQGDPFGLDNLLKSI
ncbi:MAG: hypothetical protein HY823_14990 [Acidobacteria bacterium]|nr:hypothetical protein [Acidobacteriota bacterium]